jgi:hypothetical protein
MNKLLKERIERANLLYENADKHDFSNYLTPTNVELNKMITCGKCEFNKPFTLELEDGRKKHTRFCVKNFHYVENNTIQLSCWFNKQHLLENTFLNRIKLKLRKS